MKILMVDDDKELTKAVEAALSSFDHDIQTTNDPRAGLKLIREQNYDLILLDLSMPEYTGCDIIENLANNGTIKEKKIVIMTASAVSEKELEHLIDLGAHSTLQKPVDVDALLDKIEEVDSS